MISNPDARSCAGRRCVASDLPQTLYVDLLMMVAAGRHRTLFAETAAHRMASAARAQRRTRQLRLRRSWARPARSCEVAA